MHQTPSDMLQTPPDTTRHASDTTRHASYTTRHAKDNTRLGPDTIRHAPDTIRHYQPPPDLPSFWKTLLSFLREIQKKDFLGSETTPPLPEIHLFSAICDQITVYKSKNLQRNFLDRKCPSFLNFSENSSKFGNAMLSYIKPQLSKL